MTSESQHHAKAKGGRPFGSFGPRRRQQELVRQYIAALGGNVTPLQESDIARAVSLKSIAEGTRQRIEKAGATVTAQEILALAKLEAVADAALKRLHIPVATIDTGQRPAVNRAATVAVEG